MPHVRGRGSIARSACSCAAIAGSTNLAAMMRSEIPSTLAAVVVTQKLMEIVADVIIGNYHKLRAVSGTSAQQLGDLGTHHCRLAETCISIQA